MTGDTIDGGPGTETAIVDPYDSLTRVEWVSTGAP
jgi:hypothetical protein